MKSQSINSLDQIATHNQKLITSKTHTNFYHKSSHLIPQSQTHQSPYIKVSTSSHIVNVINLLNDRKIKTYHKSTSESKLPHSKVSQNLRINTFQQGLITKSKYSQSQQMISDKTNKKMSTYALSTMSSFARTYDLTELKVLPSKRLKTEPKRLSKNKIKLKTNPEEIPNNKTIIIENIDLLSKKKLLKINEFKNEVAKTNTIQKTINEKIMTEGNEEWQRKYLRKRISSFSKISTNISEMNQIFVKKPSATDEAKVNKLNKQRNETPSSNHLEHQKNSKLKEIQKELISTKRQEFRESRRNSVQPELNLAELSARHNFRSTTKLNSQKYIKSLVTVDNSPLISPTKYKKQILQKGNISFILQKEVSTQKQISQQKSYHKPLKLHTETVYNHFKKHKTKSINTLTSFEDSLIQGKLYQDEQRSLIQDIRKQRISEKLSKQPKQWQFYNFLNLNKIQLYQTNLSISAESWIALDYLQLKFLRGWQIKTNKNYFMIGLRLIAVKCLQRLVSEHKIDLSRIKHRIHYKNLKHRIQMAEWHRSSKTQDEEEGYTMRNHTIVSMEALVIGMCRVQHCEDLVMCLVYLCGYLMDRLGEGGSARHQDLDALYNQPIFFKENVHLHFYVSKFINDSQLIAQQLNLSSVSIIDPHSTSLKFESHSLDLSILFMSCMTYDFFEGICLGKVSSDVTVKYQVGWNHWETRNHYFRNEFGPLAGLGFFGFKDINLVPTTIDKVKKPKLQSLLVYHPIKKTIIVIGGAQINMGINDLVEIDKWIMKTFKRFYKEENRSYKLCQLLHGNQLMLNTKKQFQSKEKQHVWPDEN